MKATCRLYISMREMILMRMKIMFNKIVEKHPSTIIHDTMIVTNTDNGVTQPGSKLIF